MIRTYQKRFELVHVLASFIDRSQLICKKFYIDMHGIS